MTEEAWKKEKQEYEEMMERDKGWFFALQRDLSEKIKECELLNAKLAEKDKVVIKLSKEMEKLETLIERRAVDVEIRLSRDGKQKRYYCGVCGCYIGKDTFCRRCGTLHKKGGNE